MMESEHRLLACSRYLELLKSTEPELTPEQLALARESFIEGWVQRERLANQKVIHGRNR